MLNVLFQSKEISLAIVISNFKAVCGHLYSDLLSSKRWNKVMSIFENLKDGINLFVV